MNEYRFSDLRVGMEAEFDQVVTGGGYSYYNYS